MSTLLQVIGCDRCPATPSLVVCVGGERLCSACWRAAGQPRADDLGPTHEVEEATRKRMQECGGPDRYRVVAGKS